MNEEQIIKRAEMYSEKMLSAKTQEDADMYRQLMNYWIDKLKIKNYE